MDWQRTSFDWNRARAFLATAEAGSFSGAARALGLAQPTLSRQVAALEAELDVILFERVGRGLKLTPTGLDILEHLRAMAEAAERMSMVAAGQRLSLNGSILISASEVTAAYILPGVLAPIRREHPGISIEIVATNQPSDLRKREADIAIRSFRPQEPSLIARKIREERAYLYATPGYLASIGNPHGLDELQEADFIGFDRSDALIKGLRTLDLHLTPDHFPLLTENSLVQWALAKAGLGIAIMAEGVGEQEPGMVRVLPDMKGFPLPMWLVCHRELRTSRRVRVVFDALVKGLSPQAT